MKSYAKRIGFKKASHLIRDAVLQKFLEALDQTLDVLDDNHLSVIPTEGVNQNDG